VLAKSATCAHGGFSNEAEYSYLLVLHVGAVVVESTVQRIVIVRIPWLASACPTAVSVTCALRERCVVTMDQTVSCAGRQPL
jgi:hypothetical protein